MSRTEVERWETAHGLTITIHVDEDAQSPREWDNLGTMVCWHRRYNLGDKHDHKTPDDFLAWLLAQPGYKQAVVLPLYLMDHSGLAMSTSDFNDPWDSGQVGWVYVLPEKIRKEYSCERMSDKVRQKVREVLTGEVETYSQYLRGDVYGFVIEDANEETLDSCWGFFGYDYCKEQAEDAAEHCVIVEQP